MKRWFLALVLVLVFSPVFAADPPPPKQQPATANKVEGPVTGHLADTIQLHLDRAAITTRGDADPVTISFCAPKTVEEQDFFLKRKVTHTVCVTPDRKLHITGRRQNTSITMTPAVDGEWRWDSDYTLIFTPKKAWPAAQDYSVHFDAAILPEPAKLVDFDYHFTTATLSANITSMEFFQDPNDVEKRGVTTIITFNYPVDAESVRQHLNFTLEELSDGEKLLERKVVSKTDNMPFHVKLDETGMEANISTPIKELADKERFLHVTIQPGLMAKSGGKPLESQKIGDLQQRTRVPSLYDYAEIGKIDLRIVKNEHYVPEQILVIHSNVPVTNDELAKHLKIYQLPKDKPAPDKDSKPVKDYDWTSANEINDEMLAKLPEVAFEMRPTAEPYAGLHSIKLDTAPNRWLYVRVSKDLHAKGGFILAQDHNDTMEVPQYSKEVAILSDGALLSLSGDKKISLYSLGSQKLRFKIQRVMNDDINHLVSQSSGSFTNPDFNYNFAARNISESFSEDLPLNTGDLRKPQFSAFDFTPYLTKNPGEHGWLTKGEPKGKGLFFLTVEGVNKDEKGNEITVATTHRFVLVSDLGLVVKTGRSGRQDVFVQSVKSGDPVSGVQVEVLGINGLPIISTDTDAEGHAFIPNLEGFTNEKQPTAYVLRNGDDLAFMGYNARDRKLNYSKFDVDGSRVAEDELRAYMFSDRGIYRPGEEIHVGIVAKQGDWSKNLTNVPLQMEITNPRGQVIDKPIVKLTSSGIAEYSFSTFDTSPTGLYNVRLYVTATGSKGPELGSTNVRVEEFLPDTLKIKAAFNKPAAKGWLTPDGLKADVSLEHLYGAPAADHRVRASVNVIPGNFSFKEFADYEFYDAKKAEKDFEQPAGDQQTNEEGKTSFNLDLTQFGNSTYRLTFGADGFAQDSGRSVHTSATALVSPLTYVIGMKTVGNPGYINKGDKRALDLLAVDHDLTPIAVKDLKLQIAEITYASTLIENERGAYEYRSIPRETPVSNAAFSIPAEGVHYALDTGKPGNYVLILSDADGLVRECIPYSIVGAGNLSHHVRKDVAITVRLDKQSYEPGDHMTMNIVSPYTGTGLITLETDRVLAFKWFKTSETSTIQTIDIPKDFTGKGFVNVQFVRALDSREIYTKPLAYDVQPFFVKADALDSDIRLNVPEKIKPGDTLTVRYSVKKPGKIIVFAIDEGILQYAHYKTPDPLNFFVNQRALQVGTTQILDLLMPEYSIMQELSASGGGEGIGGGKTLNPFKRKTQPPVAYWSGILDADTDTKQVQFSIPDYFNGSLRVMAVAVSDQTIGAAEKKTNVQGDIIVSPNVPLFAAPGDEFTVGVSVANNLAGSGKNAQVKLAVTPTEQLDVTSGKDTMLTVPEGGEVKTEIHVKAKDVLGGATLAFVASEGSQSAHIEETLSVRPPLPSMTALLSGYAEKGEKDVKQDRDIYKEFGAANASVSTLPISLIPGLSEYLVRYPYGCTEQTVSKAFPAVILYGQKDLGGDARIVTDSVVNTMRRLTELQNHEGGFGYWWFDSGKANDFVSVYALHYMQLAREKHLPVPDETFRRAQAYVTTMVNHSPSSLDEARVEAYGIYVLTRAGVVTANYLPNLLQYLETYQKDTWHNDLTAVYIAGAYRLMQLKPEADKLISDFTLGDPKYWSEHNHYWYDNDFYNSLNRYAQYLTVVSDNFPDLLPKLDRNILFRVANFIGEGSFNTLSSSYAIMALSAYGQASMNQAQGNLSISQQDQAGAWKPTTLTGEQVKRAQLALASSSVRFAGGSSYGLFYQLATNGYDRTLPTQPIEDGLEINRQYLGADHQPIKEVNIGDTVDVVVTMRAHDNQTLSNIALVDLLPAGFEVVPESIKRPDTPTADDNNANNEGDEAPAGHNHHHAAETPVADDSAAFSGTPWVTTAIDVREDRVIAFGDVPSDDVVYHYKIKAVNAGSFITPPAYAESMYDRAVKARGVAGSIVVKPH